MLSVMLWAYKNIYRALSLAFLKSVIKFFFLPQYGSLGNSPVLAADLTDQDCFTAALNSPP